MLKNKLLLLGSIVSPCPPKKQGGTERVAYYQAKQLAKRGISIIFVCAKGSKENFIDQLKFEQESEINQILNNVEFVEIGGGTGFGNQEDAIKLDPSTIEASRKLRIEMINLAQVQKIMIDRKDEYDLILNNMRGEAVFLPLATLLGKKIINVMHLNLFPELAEIFLQYKTPIITISNAQKETFPDLNYLATIYNPINIKTFAFNPIPKNYALMVSTVGIHKNQKDAIIACQKANMPLIIAGKIRDQDYFNKEIKPFVDGINVIYHGELDFEEKLKLYQEAKAFLFPIKWQEPFGLVVIEALCCGTPVIAYPNGGPKEIIVNNINGYLVNNSDEMADKIGRIDQIKRDECRRDIEKRFSEDVIGDQYYKVINI